MDHVFTDYVCYNYVQHSSLKEANDPLLVQPIIKYGQDGFTISTTYTVRMIREFVEKQFPS